MGIASATANVRAPARSRQQVRQRQVSRSAAADGEDVEEQRKGGL
jgi:hypothetical protein